MPSHFDARHVRRAFARAANSYDAAAALQREVQARLVESLDYLEARKPEVVLDIGAGTGHASALMKKRWPKAQVIALDVALPMLDQAKRQAGWWKPFQRLCGDAAALPLADNSVDVIFSNLCLQWVDDLRRYSPDSVACSSPGACCCAPPSARTRWSSSTKPLRPPMTVRT